MIKLKSLILKEISNDPYVIQQKQKVEDILKDPVIKNIVGKYIEKEEKASGLEFGRGCGYDSKTNSIRTGTKSALTRVENELRDLLRQKGSDLTPGNILAVLKKQGRFEET